MPRGQEQYLYLTTTGRRSGKPREIEIWCTEADARFYVIAEHATSNWVQNIRVRPAVKVRIGRRRFAARGRVLDERLEPELVSRVRERSRQKYGWGEGLVVELIPVEQSKKAPL